MSPFDVILFLVLVGNVIWSALTEHKLKTKIGRMSLGHAQSRTQMTQNRELLKSQISRLQSNCNKMVSKNNACAIEHLQFGETIKEKDQQIDGLGSTAASYSAEIMRLNHVLDEKEGVISQLKKQVFDLEYKSTKPDTEVVIQAPKKRTRVRTVKRKDVVIRDKNGRFSPA